MLTCKLKSSQPTTVTFKKLFKLKKNWRVKLQLKQWKIKSQQFTKKNMQTTKSLIASCGTWLKSWNKWNTQKCAVWSQKTRFVRMVVRSMKSVLWMHKLTIFLVCTVQVSLRVDKRKPFLSWPWHQWVKPKSSMVWIQSTRNALCTTITSHNIL